MNAKGALMVLVLLLLIIGNSSAQSQKPKKRGLGPEVTLKCVPETFFTRRDTGTKTARSTKASQNEKSTKPGDSNTGQGESPINGNGEGNNSSLGGHVGHSGVGGPIRYGDGPTGHSLAAHSTDTYSINFKGGETAYIYVSGDGDTDLEVYVYDKNGNLIASDTDYTDDCIISFKPRWTSTFTVKVVNRGSVYNNYTIRHN